jgi:hypothetical protein
MVGWVCFILKIFLQDQGDINSQDANFGWSLLSILSSHMDRFQDNETMQHLYKIIKVLVDSGVNFDIGCCYKTNDRYKAIHNACSAGNIALIRLLLESHHHTNRKDPILMDRVLQSEYDEYHKQTMAFHVVADMNNFHLIPVTQLLLQ